MNRRDGLRVVSGTILCSAIQPRAFGLLVGPILRILLGISVRGTANVAARSVASRAVTMSVSRAGLTSTVQAVTTREIGVSIAGVAALSIPAAELLAEYNCQAIFVKGVDETVTVISNALSRPTHITVEIYNSITGRVEDYRREYANSGNFEFKFQLPWEGSRTVKRLNGRADDDHSVPHFSTGNILFTESHDVIYE
jgi:hypothetical protein